MMKPILNRWFKRALPEDSFESLLAPHFDTLYRAAYQFTGHQQDAEDLVQELLLKLYPKSAELTVLENPRTWLLRSLYNLFIDQHRKSTRNPLRQRIEYTGSGEDAESRSLLDDMPGYEPGPEKMAHNGTLQAGLEQALDGLGEDQRTIVLLCDVEGYSLNEVAEILDIPIGTVKSRLFRAHRLLREALPIQNICSEDLSPHWEETRHAM